VPIDQHNYWVTHGTSSPAHRAFLDRLPPGLASVILAAWRVFAGPDGLFALGLVLALGAVIEVDLYSHTWLGDSGDVTTAYLANLATTLPLVIARRHLLIAASLITVGMMVVVSDPAAMFTLSGIIGQLVVLYLVAMNARRWLSVAFAVPFLANAVAPFSGDEPGGSGFLLLVLVVAVQVLGIAQHQRGLAIAERDATKEAMALTLREQAAMGERARIARELHDVVAHHLSMIAVQAETARLTTAELPDQGRQRFEEIAGTARDALTEMRRLLGVLRDDAGVALERSPQPGLDRLNDLVDAARSAGSDVRLVLRGRVVALSPGIDLTAYRIVQEALTNARRHAPDASVDVELTYGANELQLRVRDNGPGVPAGAMHGGHGIVGMYERVAMVGGTVTAGPGPAGGFVVEADLPLREETW
jgi:signal transduction histidine kinase